MLLFNLCMHAKSLQSGLTLCDLMDCSLPDSSVHGILKARILEWVSCPPQGIFPTQGSNPPLLHLLHWRWVFFFTTIASWEAHPSIQVHLINSFQVDFSTLFSWWWQSLNMTLGTFSSLLFLFQNIDEKMCLGENLHLQCSPKENKQLI